MRERREFSKRNSKCIEIHAPTIDKEHRTTGRFWGPGSSLTVLKLNIRGENNMMEARRDRQRTSSARTFYLCHNSQLTLSNQWLSEGVPGPAASASPRNLLEMQILGPHPIIRNSEGGSQQSVFNKPSGDSDACSSLRIIALEWRGATAEFLAGGRQNPG